MKLNIVILGLSITSSWGNGHATTYRALVRALARRGHAITFLERDQPWYRDHRDFAQSDDVTLHLYESLSELAQRHGAAVSAADLVIVGSYVPDGAAIGEWVTRQARGVTAFYDIDTPVTLAGLETGAVDYVTPALIPRYDLYLSFSGGPALGLIEDLYGGRLARPLYCSADPELHREAAPAPRWSLGYLGTYSDDRQPQLDAFLIAPARALANHAFVVAGAQYPAAIAWPANVERIDHLPPAEHAAFYGAQRFTLNVTRADMRALGFSPSVRLFEAAACGAPVISDSWPGFETILTPGAEALVVSSPAEVIDILANLPEERRRSIAANARKRLLAEHTADHRARQLETYYLEALDQPRATTRAAQAAD